VPRFTVLMPTQSRPDVIGYAIQSVLDQTEPDFELLVVGDGAVPETENAVTQFSDARIKWFNLPKAPYYGYANRNIALAQSSGELIAFAADDDLMFPDHLELLGAALSDQRRRLAYSQALWVSTDGIAAPCLTNLELDDELFHFMKQRNTIAAGCVVYRASAIATRSCWPEDIEAAADWRLWQRIIETHGAATVTHVRVPTCLHFSARWKQSRYSRFHLLREWLAIADASPWWPASLRVAIPDGLPEQAVFSRLMRDGGQAWCANIRRAVGDLIAKTAHLRVSNPPRAG
jgi:glycosyltransferase involved in cell wall biosynthesis